ncbi:MAG: 16S rRNA (guanine(966)-N(2))-methyltransferase RsmD [Lachnospiraceae bacterium]|nr:16S rRNA (guanine(966)-N(2))-methyltransferase RsmD [Lachnospiraceae bacterium]
MRVIAGSAKRLQLKTVAGLDTRPTTDRIKETLFNMIAPNLFGSTCLDLFSGSGAIGIEALSRGAKKCVFVEQDGKALKCIQENLINTKLTVAARVMARDAITALRLLEGEERFDYIFMDPPYESDLEKRVLEYLSDSALIDVDSVIVIESAKRKEFAYLENLGFLLIKEKIYKTNKHVFVKRQQEERDNI